MISSPQTNFVAFIDLLGFSDMVKKDLEAPNGTEKYMERLYRIHQETVKLSQESIQLDVVQFSDSIILATEFKKENFREFLWIISKYQFDLFSRGILARGGVAYGRHFYENGFLYSLGLIEAYRIENKIAKNPRIIVSNDLLQLLYEDEDEFTNLPLHQENDGLWFIDYLHHCREEGIEKYMEIIKFGIDNDNVAVREKYIWLCDYAKFKYPEATLTAHRFRY